VGRDRKGQRLRRRVLNARGSRRIELFGRQPGRPAVPALPRSPPALRPADAPTGRTLPGRAGETRAPPPSPECSRPCSQLPATAPTHAWPCAAACGTGRDPAVRICCSRSRCGPILGCGRGCVWRYPGGSLWVRIFWSVRQCIPVSRRICRRLTPSASTRRRILVHCSMLRYILPFYQDAALFSRPLQGVARNAKLPP
jgi:hypothetical protein